MIIKLLKIGLVVGLVAACEENLKDVEDTEQAAAENSSSTQTPLVDTSQQPTVPVSISVTEDTSEGLALTNTPANSFSVDVAGCASGYTKTNHSSGSITLYQNDLNCLVQLTTFEINGVTYTNVNDVGDEDFDTYADGDTAVFVNNGDINDKIAVTLVTQLNSPIGTSETVSYTFTEIEERTGQSGLDVSDGQNISVAGLDAPNLNLISAALVGSNAIDGTSGAGIFTMQLECVDAVLDATTTCSDLDMNSMDYALVTELSANPSTTDLANAITAAGNDSKNTVTAGGVIHVASAAVVGTNGGIVITSVHGPGALHTNNNMSLIVRMTSGGNESYTYYDISFTQL